MMADLHLVTQLMKPKLLFMLSHRHSTTVSLETYFLLLKSPGTSTERLVHTMCGIVNFDFIARSNSLLEN